MSATPSTDLAAATLDARLPSRIVKEGYGPGAWHGPDLRAALADVTDAQAFRRPETERHNIAEIAMHHAWCVRSAIAQLTGSAGDPFPLDGSDWFELNDEELIDWPAITALVAGQHARLAQAVAAEGVSSSVSAAERFDLVLGVTCHAVYHAGQVQLIKKLCPA